MALERTLAIIKPDAVGRNVVGQIIGRAEEEGLSVVAIKFLKLSRDQASKFYHVHRKKKFFASLVSYMCEGPIVVMVLEGESAILCWRSAMGATDPSQAEMGTIRQSFGQNVERNSVHGSDSLKAASFEVGCFFESWELTERIGLTSS